MRDDLDFSSLDASFERAFDVAKVEGPDGTFYLATNSPDGRAAVEISMHPHLAKKLRDWLIENYSASSAVPNWLDSRWWECGSCRSSMVNLEHFYCPGCGVKLDWARARQKSLSPDKTSPAESGIYEILAVNAASVLDREPQEFEQAQQQPGWLGAWPTGR